MGRGAKLLSVCLWLTSVWGLGYGETADARSDEGLSTGQTVYVPVYSHIYQGDRESPVYLAVTLSIRNVDPDRPITVESADYHETKGQLVRKYQQGPVQLPPLTSIRHVVPESDKTGGSGAFFRVVWRADTPVNPPILESVMIGTKSQQGISFSSRGVAVTEGSSEARGGQAHDRILQMAREWGPALTSGSIDRNMAFFSDDALIAGGGKGDIHVGYKKVRERLEHQLNNYTATEPSLAVRSVAVGDDWARLMGEFRAVWKPRKAGAAEEREASNYVWVLKRQTDGAYKIARFLFYPAD